MIKNYKDDDILKILQARLELANTLNTDETLWENVVNKDFPPYFVEMAGHNNIEKYAKDYL